MAPFGSLALLCLLLACCAATDVHQCPDSNFQNLKENVQLTCKKLPCLLKKGTDQHISITFTPEQDIADIKNHVTAEVFGLPVPFIGVDGNSICDKIFTESGEKAICPVKKDTKYVYKDSFPVLSIYPSISVTVHWELSDGKKNIVCFEIPARIR